MMGNRQRYKAPKHDEHGELKMVAQQADQYQRTMENKHDAYTAGVGHAIVDK